MISRGACPPQQFCDSPNSVHLLKEIFLAPNTCHVFHEKVVSHYTCIIGTNLLLYILFLHWFLKILYVYAQTAYLLYRGR